MLLVGEGRTLIWFCFTTRVEIGNVPEGGDSACSEVFGGDAGAGETDEGVSKRPDGSGDLQPAQKRPPRPRVQAHPNARVLRTESRGKMRG